MSLHELVTLLEAGVSVADTLESQCSASYPADLANGYTVMAAEIQRIKFSDALRLSKIRVPIYMLQLAEAGELVGDLSGSLRKGLSQYEYELNLAKEFRTALAYPSILILFGIGGSYINIRLGSTEVLAHDGKSRKLAFNFGNRVHGGYIF